MRTVTVALLILLCALGAQAAPLITVSASSVSILGTSQTISLTCTLVDPNNTGNLRSGGNVITVFVTSSATPGTTATCGPIYGSDTIIDGYGNSNTTYYKVQVFTVSGGIIASTPALQQFYAFTGSGTVDLSTATPLAPSFFTGPSGNVSMPGTLNVTGATTLSSLTITSTPGIKYVSSGNPQAWAGADACAWINSAISALPTVTINSVAYPVGIVDITGLASVSSVACGTTVLTKGSPGLWLRGPGRDSLIFSCTVNGDCFNAQQGTGFSITPGFKMSGFSVLGQGSSNANAVGIHIGDMVGGSLEDIAVDNFLGTSSSCIWADNVNGFFESNYWIRVWTGAIGGSQLGCTKNRRFTNTGNVLGTSSFGHNSFINEQISVANGKTGISIEGGTLFSENWIIDGALISSTNATFLAMSGLAYGGGPNAGLNGNLFFKMECPVGCSSGTLLNLPAGYTITLHSGEIIDLSGLLTPISGAGVVQQIQQTLPAGSNIFSLQAQTATNSANFSSPKANLAGSIWNGAAGVTDTYLLQDVVGSGTNPATTYTLTHSGSSGTATADFSSLAQMGVPPNLDIGGTPGVGNHTQFKNANGAVVTGVAGSLFNLVDTGIANVASMDTSGNLGVLGGVRVGGISSWAGSTAALTADWTCGTGGTVASCVAATIIGSGGGVPLTFTLPSVAASYTLVCDGVVGQATAATANQWNLLTATNGATNVTADYSMATAATASAYGAVTDQASTTTTFQIGPSWTLGGTATKMPFHIWAKVEGASASGTVLSLQLVAPTVGDLVTIYRGTSCRIF